MKKAIANRTFRRTDTKEIVRAGKSIIAPDSYLNELEKGGLVRSVAAIPRAPEVKPVPIGAVGERSSALPAVRALPEQTLSASKSGGRKRRVDVSL